MCSAILGYGVGAGMVIPYVTHNGDAPYARVKLDHAGQMASAIAARRDGGNRLYIPPTLDPKLLADPTQPLWITEGEKKSLKATQEGLPCLALSGVWSWRQKLDDGSRARSPIWTA